jgi:uncharacterized membrane protein
MTRIAIAYAATLAAFCILDFIWLGFVARGYYQSQIGALLLDKPHWGAAILFYLLYAAGVMVFVVAPALDADSAWRAVRYGALLGLVAYATYDLSNLATLKGWTLPMAVVDVLWGAAVTGLAAAAGFAAGKLAGGAA